MEAFSPTDVAIIDAHPLTRLSGATSTKFRYFLIVYFFHSLASHVRCFLASDICDPDRGLISRAHPESRAPSTPRTPRITLVIHSPATSSAIAVGQLNIQHSRDAKSLSVLPRTSTEIASQHGRYTACLYMLRGWGIQFVDPACRSGRVPAKRNRALATRRSFSESHRMAFR